MRWAGRVRVFLLCRYGTGFQIRYRFSLFYSDAMLTFPPAMASPAHHSNKRILSFLRRFGSLPKESQSLKCMRSTSTNKGAIPLFHFVSSHLTFSFFFIFIFFVFSLFLACRTGESHCTARTLHSGVSNSPPPPWP